MKNLILALCAVCTLALPLPATAGSSANEVCVASFGYDNDDNGSCTATDVLATLRCAVDLPVRKAVVTVCTKHGCEQVELDDFRDVDGGAVCVKPGFDNDADSDSDSDSN